MDSNFKLKYFLENGPSESVQKLRELLDQVNRFTKDIAPNNSCQKSNSGIDSDISNFEHTNVAASSGKILVSSRPCSNVANQFENDIQNKNIRAREVIGSISATSDYATKNLKGSTEFQVNNDSKGDSSSDSKTYSESSDELTDYSQGNESDLNEKKNDESKTSGSEYAVDSLNLKRPLTKGWRRETYISNIERSGQIQGRVIYYAPGSRVELKDIAQVQMILEKQPSDLPIDNFSFSTCHIVGLFFQQYSSSSDSKYYCKSDVQMAKVLSDYKWCTSQAELRKMKRSKGSHEVAGNKRTVGDEMKDTSDEISPNKINGIENMEIDEKKDKLGSAMRLFKIDDSENFYDEKGFLYSKNNSTQIQNSYFRCKNSKRYGCSARAKAVDNDFEKAILTRPHNHLPRPGRVDKEKFDKQLGKECDQNPFLYAREIYAKTRKRMKGKIDPDNIPLKGKYDTLINRKKRKYVPKLPKTIIEFEELIQDYKDQYFYDERDLPFYREVWKTNSGDSNIVFISESVSEKMKEMKVKIHMLMDGTFKVLPKHLKFRQLYIISIIYEDRCYPLSFILMEKKTYSSYNLIFGKLKLMFPSCEITNFMTDYEAATRKALKKFFPLARISGCYFHYVKAINKASRRFGLSKDAKFELAIQKVSALALLPNEFVSKGFKIIDQENQKFRYSLRWGRFKKYWSRQWEKANISVYGLKHRTNNFAESMNRSLNLLAKVKGPNIWILIEHLKTLEMDKTDELRQHSKGVIIKTTKPGSDEMNRLNKIIREATKEFREEQDVAKFLRRVTCGDKLENFFKERIYLEGIDEYDRDEDSGFDENEEDFLPNDFNVTCDFFCNQSTVAGTLKRKIPTSNSPKPSTNKSKKRRVS